MMKVYEFDGEIKGQDLIDGAYVEFPYNVEKEFGAKGRVKVKETFDGLEYRGSLVIMGLNCHIIGITKRIRNEISKQPGDIVHVIIVEGNEPRIVEVPEDFRNLLEENEKAKEFFNSLSYSNKKKYVDWILSAKKIETRNKRITETLNMLEQGIKRN